MTLNFIHLLQGWSTPLLDQFFIYVTMLGEEYFYLFVLSFLYWCVNKDAVRYFVMILTFSGVLNGALKEIFNTSRPFQVEDIRALRTETAHGSSFPSGHTQTVTAFYGALAFKFKRIWLWIVAVVVIIFVGISRIYLGLHWPIDVLAGIAFGCLSIYVIHQITQLEKNKGYEWPYYLLSFIVLAGLIFLRSETYIKASAAFLGFMAGYLIEDNYVKFEVRTSLFNQLIKYVLGLALTFAIFEGLKLIFPAMMIFTFIRYFMTIFFVVAVVPWIFVVLKLSKHRFFN